MGVDLSENDLYEIMDEIDVDRKGSIDIDQFIALMSLV
jgi:Ca2+-binding EF-hand superfamily protein